MEENDYSQKMKTNCCLNIFENANRVFLQEQKGLILSDVSERSWYTHFAMNIKEELEKNNVTGYYVDTEYNRNNGKLKTIFDNEQDIKVIKITCDIIVHSRGENIKQDNLICIEMKKSTANKSDKIKDKKRVQTLTKDSFDDVWSYDGKALPEHVCRYKLGVYYEINIKKHMVHIEYYKKGKKTKEYDMIF